MTDIVRKPIDKYIPWFFVSFFVVLSGLMAGFAWLATSTERGVVSAHAYQNGLAYNRTIEKQRAQDALGWTSDLKIEKQPSQNAHIHFKLADKNNKPLAHAQVQFMLIRPTQAGHDITLALKEDAPGSYFGEAPVPLKGLWEARITVKYDEYTYQAGQRVTLN